MKSLGKTAYEAAHGQILEKGEYNVWDDTARETKLVWEAAALAVAMAVDPNYKVKLAFAAGEKIECRLKASKPDALWFETADPQWNKNYEYRVVEKPPEVVTASADVVAPEWRRSVHGPVPPCTFIIRGFAKEELNRQFRATFSIDKMDDPAAERDQILASEMFDV